MGRMQEWLKQARQNGEDPLIKIIWIWGMILVFCFVYFIWNTFLYGGIISEPGDSSIGRGDRGRAYFRDMVYEKGISREVWVKAKMRNKTGRGLQN